ncbi:MAG: NTPase [Anaerolineales bacterium]|jgi:nucleoside-triphosphatase
MGKAILLTGYPGSGKTTLIQRVLQAIPVRAFGFYTREVREQGVRKGFEIVTLKGETGVLAHVDIRSRDRIGKYGVDLQALDSIGVAAMQAGLSSGGLIVVDEIGPMEILSESFRQAVMVALESPLPLLGSIVMRPQPFADRIKRLPQVTLITVSVPNRDELTESVRKMLAEMMQGL